MATKENKTKKESAFMKPVQISEALAEIVGSKAIPRTEVTKRVWDYIKKIQVTSVLLSLTKSWVKSLVRSRSTCSR